MEQKLIDLGNGFWNLRGTFCLASLSAGANLSLIQLSSGHFVLLGACHLSAELEEQIEEITGSLDNILAVLYLHPLHCANVEAMHGQFPYANHYGTHHHQTLFPHLHWQAIATDSPAINELFQDEIAFSTPKGVSFVPNNPTLRFSSVLAYHLSSKTVHVDEMFIMVEMPTSFGVFEVPSALSFHPSLSLSLANEKNAAQDFIDWAETLLEDWSSAENLCSAKAPLLQYPGECAKLYEHISNAITMAKPIVMAHKTRCMFTAALNK